MYSYSFSKNYENELRVWQSSCKILMQPWRFDGTTVYSLEHVTFPDPGLSLDKSKTITEMRLHYRTSS